MKANNDRLVTFTKSPQTGYTSLKYLILSLGALS